MMPFFFPAYVPISETLHVQGHDAYTQPFLFWVQIIYLYIMAPSLISPLGPGGPLPEAAGREPATRPARPGCSPIRNLPHVRLADRMARLADYTIISLRLSGPISRFYVRLADRMYDYQIVWPD